MAVARLFNGHVQGWHTLYEEHAWNNGESSGFADVVIENQYRTWLMNLECKRVRDSEWIFLIDRTSAGYRRHAKVWITFGDTERTLRHFSWIDVAIEPYTLESSICVVPGQDPKVTPMLERVAATVVASTAAIAAEEEELTRASGIGLRVYQNVIVTTAQLLVCDVDTADINIATGDVGETATFSAVPYLRFRKQLGSGAPVPPQGVDDRELGEYAKRKESTVFIVNASHLAEFVQASDLPNNLDRVIGVR